MKDGLALKIHGLVEQIKLADEPDDRELQDCLMYLEFAAAALVASQDIDEDDILEDILGPTEAQKSYVAPKEPTHHVAKTDVWMKPEPQEQQEPRPVQRLVRRRR